MITGTVVSGDVFSSAPKKGLPNDLGSHCPILTRSRPPPRRLDPGDNTNALALVAIHTNRQVDLGNVTLNRLPVDSIGDVGNATRESQLALQSKSLEGDQLTAMRESVSGVSLDEELTNLLSFQRSFEASARMITVADELMQTILAMGR